jgi:CheY-like chemotaxis protein
VNILITEDAAAIRQTIAVVLRSCGHDVVAAANGVEALACVDARCPDLIVLDLILPVMDGREFLRILRQRPGCAQIPVVVVTAEHGVMASELGVQRLLAKPFDLEQLLEAIDELLLGPRVNPQTGASLSQAGSRDVA